jgi:DNA-binding NarL/FixJ family response regulator
VPEYTGPMPVILVLDDDGAARDALVATLRNLFTRARIVAARGEAGREAAAREDPSVVLASLDAAERLCRAGAPSGVSVVALTREMSPDTLLRAEALGIAGALRAPAAAQRLAAALGPMLGGVAGHR